MKRRIACLSGKRGGFGALLPTLLQIKAHPELELVTIVTDMHLNEVFGLTVTEVKQWLQVAHEVDMEQRDDSPTSRAKAIGVGLMKMADLLAAIRPDMLLLLGDRGEVLAMAIAALNMNIPVAHVQGGDVSGNIDEVFRHAITKMSHLHFVSTPQSAKRVRRLGEEPWRIFEVGDPHVDLIVQQKYTPGAAVRERYGIEKAGGLIIVLQHPVTGEVEEAYTQMQATLEAVCQFRRQTLIVYPCSDPGHAATIRAIREIEHLPFVRVHKNIPCHDFLGLLSIADVMVGNSSAGLIETPYFPLPALNVGTRQQGRERAENVLDVPYSSEQITSALKEALFDEAFRERARSCRRPFGDGRTCDRITHILATTPLNGQLLNKRMTF